MLTERGNIYGYNNLVVDYRNLVDMRGFGYPVIMDCTHAVQRPGGMGGASAAGGGGAAESASGVGGAGDAATAASSTAASSTATASAASSSGSGGGGGGSAAACAAAPNPPPTVSCQPGVRADCNADWHDGCETIIFKDPKNCGACNKPCASGYCAQGACAPKPPPAAQYPGCAQDKAECGGAMPNDCETNIASDSNNCGGCGFACKTGYECSYGQCIAAPPSCGFVYNEALNCGACGITCATGKCLGTDCLPPPKVLAAFANPVERIVASEDDLYVASQPSIYSVSKATGMATLLTGSFGKVDRLVLDATTTFLYWSEPGGIWRVPLPAGAAQKVIAFADVHAIGVNSSHVYWYTEVGAKLYRVPIAGGAAEVVFVGPAPGGTLYGSSILADDVNVYINGTQGGWSYFTLPIAGGSGSFHSTGTNNSGGLEGQTADTIVGVETVKSGGNIVKVTFPKGYSSPGGNGGTSFQCNIESAMGIAGVRCLKKFVITGSLQPLVSDGSAAYYACPGGLCRVCF
jgi:hypothetical protein